MVDCETMTVTTLFPPDGAALETTPDVTELAGALVGTTTEPDETGADEAGPDAVDETTTEEAGADETGADETVGFVPGVI